VSEQAPTKITYWLRWIIAILIGFSGIALFNASVAEAVISSWLCRLTLEIDYG
jgi:hypothetical protein